MTGSMAGSMAESMAESIAHSEFLKRFREMLLQFEYEPSGFPLKNFETIAEAIASLGEISDRNAERRRDKSNMLEMVLHDDEFCEKIITALNKLENLEFHITNLRCFLEKITEKTFTEECAKQISEFYNRLNYAVYDACGPEELHIIKSYAAMAEATSGMSYHDQRFCWGDDISIGDDDDYFSD